MKTKEDILQQFTAFTTSSSGKAVAYRTDHILEAMEEYASQFKQRNVELFKLLLPEGLRIDYIPDSNMPKTKAIVKTNPDNIPQPPKAEG